MPRNQQVNLLISFNQLRKVSVYKINGQTLLMLLFASRKLENKIKKKKLSHITVSKNQVLRNTFEKRYAIPSHREL